MNASGENAESVDAFLERIASLNNKSTREDEERTRRLEDDILQGRRERQARRAERARSLSPPKNSQLATSPLSLNLSFHESSPEHTMNPPVKLSPTHQPVTVELSSKPDSARSPTRVATQRPAPSSPVMISPPSTSPATKLSRQGTLSWQQRPSSKGSDTPRSRPHSAYAAETASAITEKGENGPTRNQIASSLSSKDPSWFRQTEDRGTSSDAYRKVAEESMAKVGPSFRQLPGMSHESSFKPEIEPNASPNDRFRPSSQISSVVDSGSRGDRFSGTSSQSTYSSNQPSIVQGPHKVGPVTEERNHEQHIEKKVATFSSHDQPPRDRPTSPTKGLGGFVQSAMMKRSDSVNKRWSAQAPVGLSRGNSVASYRGGLGQTASIAPGPGSPPREHVASSQGHSSSASAVSRPSSSHSPSTGLGNLEHSTHPTLQSTASTQAISPSSRPGVASESPSKENRSKVQEMKESTPTLQSLEVVPTSPTKTMDPKRWSPTKASWLESALARPESPKLTSPKTQTPSWMADLQKSKLSRDASDAVKTPGSSFTVVSPTGLLRSPPTSSPPQPLSFGGVPQGISAGHMSKSSEETPRHPLVEHNQASQRDSSSKNDPFLEAAAEPSKHNPGTFGESLRDSPKPAEDQDEAESTWTDQKEKSVPSPKTKLESPPRTDFRSNLKSRETVAEANIAADPEFKNVFGKLKRTETKNYVAPDELKNNILRGKAALNTTGGPQKTKRVDEFKESILKKKESMKIAASQPSKSVAGAGHSDLVTQKPSTVPEALAKRNALNKRTDSSVSSAVARSPNQPLENLPAATVKAVERSLQSPGKQPLSRTQVVHPPGATGEEASSDQKMPGVQRQDPSCTGVRASSNNTEASRKFKDSALRQPHGFPEKPQSPKSGTAEKTTSTLASRLNPDLAGILTRGPTSTIGSKNDSTEDVGTKRNIRKPLRTEESGAKCSSQLTHMTKARAKGPKRRLPKTVSPDDKPQGLPRGSKQNDVSEQVVPMAPPQKSNKFPSTQDNVPSAKGQDPSVPPRALANLVNKNDKVARPAAPKRDPVPTVAGDKSGQKAAAPNFSSTETKEKAKPAVAAKSPTLRKVSSPSSSGSASVIPESEQKSSAIGEQPSIHAESKDPNTQHKLSPSAEKIVQPTNKKPSKRLPSPDSGFSPRSDGLERVDSPNSRRETRSQHASTSVRKPVLSGLGLKLESGKIQPPASQLTPPVETKTAKVSGSPDSMTQSQGKNFLSAGESASVERRDSEAAGLLNDFFGNKLRLADKIEIDALAVLSSRPNTDSKGRVLKTQVWQINADGRKEDLPPQQDHILFEDTMYICVCSFDKSAGPAATEVYLWAGDRVSEAAMEDAQLFARKEARENNTKLEFLRQGKEPSKFFQALGGIVITRRSRTSALYMLCGRRHLGHVAFDEVDLEAASLCSGFPYIISTRFGKLYLWKGRGSGADEIGCARLIGMDLGLTGEIEEVDEGEEPSGFFGSLGSNSQARVLSPQWSLRSKYGDYRCRLFRVELEQSKGMSAFWTRRGSSPSKPSKASATEISPFCQRDLGPGGIFVLDAYFSIFVYVGVEAGEKSVEFVTALEFAQEYGILTVSSEDRPSIPSCKITLHGAAPDFAAAFRKWQRPTVGPSGEAGGETCRVVDLNDALEALSGEE